MPYKTFYDLHIEWSEENKERARKEGEAHRRNLKAQSNFDRRKSTRKNAKFRW